jgi:hypothetical protein
MLEQSTWMILIKILKGDELDEDGKKHMNK